jgi:hypothetical protein
MIHNWLQSLSRECHQELVWHELPTCSAFSLHCHHHHKPVESIRTIITLRGHILCSSHSEQLTPIDWHSQLCLSSYKQLILQVVNHCTTTQSPIHDQLLPQLTRKAPQYKRNKRTRIVTSCYSLFRCSHKHQMTALTGNESNQTILRLGFKNNKNCVPTSLCATQGNIANSMLDIDMIDQLATHTKHRTTGDSSQSVNVLTVTPWTA